MKRVAVIGAGIAGASAGFWLKNAGYEVQVYEASNRLGGCMGSYVIDGFTVERGPHLFMDSSGSLRRLAEALGIGDELNEVGAIAKRRYVVCDGNLTVIPTNPQSMFATQALSTSGKLRAALEPLIPAQKNTESESVADIVRRRFGDEVLANLIDPLISATQLGIAEDLSSRYVLRGLRDLEQSDGSVIIGGIRSMRKRDQNPKTVAFGKGSWVVLEALREALKQELHLNTLVRRVRRSRDGYQISFGSNSGIHVQTFDHVVLAVPAWALSYIDFDFGDRTLTGLSGVGKTPYAPAALVSLGFEADQIEHPLDGFGLLIPSRERRRLLATIFVSSVFPDRAPTGKTLLTAILGGTRRPFDISLSDETLVHRTQADLAKILGIEAKPVFSHVARQEQALAQCDRNHHERMTELQTTLSKLRGLSLISNFSGSASVPWLVQQAEQILQDIKSDENSQNTT